MSAQAELAKEKKLGRNLRGAAFILRILDVLESAADVPGLKSTRGTGKGICSDASFMPKVVS